MNRHLVLGMFLLLSLGLFPTTDAVAQLGGLFSSGPEIKTISTEELKQRLDRRSEAEERAAKSGAKLPDPEFILVDVRSDAETKVSVIPGAITKAAFEKDLAKFKGRTVIPYCTVGGRSGAYAKQLAKKGIKVINYKGSILKWVDAGLPLVTLDGESTLRVHTYSDRYRIPSKYEQVTE